MRHSDLEPLLGASRQPSGLGRSAAQTEYCSSSFTTTLYFVSSVSSLFIESPSSIRSMGRSYWMDIRDPFAPGLCTPPACSRESQRSVCTPWSRGYLERAEGRRRLQPNHPIQGSHRADFPSDRR